ncbi:MAG: SpoIIE family protein phosphatase [Bacteroidota bacterium]
MTIRHILMLFIAVLLSLLSHKAAAQEFKGGERQVFNYSTMNTPGVEQNWCIVRDSRGVMYFGNQDNGVITYDGNSWARIEIQNNPRVLSLETDSAGYIYVGAASEFGYLSPDSKGQMAYTSLLTRLDSAEADNLGVVYSILVDGDSVIYSTNKKFFVYYPESGNLNVIDHSEAYRTVNLIWKVDGRIIAGDNTAGLVELKGNELVPMEGGDFFAYTLVRSVIPGREEGELFVGTYNKGIILYNYLTGEVNEDIIDAEVNRELKEYKLYQGVALSDDRFAVSTTTNGVYIFDTGGVFRESLNTGNSGLMDDQIYAIYLDPNNGFPVLWMTNWGYISKVYLGLPYKVIDISEWYNYALNEICTYKGDLYLSNDAGVIKSFETDRGYGFSKLEGYTNQTFPLLNFKYTGTDLLLIGTISGLYSYDGTTLRRLDKGEEGLYVRELYQMESNPALVAIGLEKGGMQFMKYTGGQWVFRNKVSSTDSDSENVIKGIVNIITEDTNGLIWFLTDDPSALYRLEISGQDTICTKMNQDNGIASSVYMLNRIGDKLMISTEEGMMSYDYDNEVFVNDTTYMSDELPAGTGVSLVYEDPEGDLWFGTHKPRNMTYYYPENKEEEKKFIHKPFSLLPNTTTPDMGFFDGHVWIIKSKQLFIVDKQSLDAEYSITNTLIRRVVINNDSTIFGGSFYSGRNGGKIMPSASQTDINIPEIKYSENDISFFFSSPFYLVEDSIRYSYKLEGFDREWSRWDYANYRDYTNLPNGSYKFMVRSRDITGSEGSTAEYKFVILRPWYLSITAIIGYMILAVFLVYLIIKLYTRRLLHENIRLEGIVAERTKEVVRQKEELEASIHYASRIQRAILPAEGSLKGKVDDYFILFKPRDIVSGDFYWVSEKGPRLFIVAADCTGHGVPGAFMSILGISFLDEIINKSDYTNTDEILNTLRTHVTASLKQMGEDDEETKDGMDMGILVINHKEEKIEFSGAYNPCWKVRPLSDEEKEKYRKGELEEDRGELSNGEYMLETIDADRMPIGISSRMGQSFTMHSQKLEEGATYYLFSDGYSDQFGGDYGRKFLKKNLKKLILDIQGVPVKQQKDLLDKRLIDWMGDMEQVDDILVMGIRISS